MFRCLLTLASVALFALLPASCGGGTDTTPTTGSVTIALTDAANDDLESFEVDVSGITLKKLDDTVVSVLVKTARVDFVELQSLAELVVAANLPLGFYKSLSMTLDFSNAVVAIKDQTAPATVLDKNGAPITGPVSVEVDFAAASRPEIVVSRRDLYQLDLDLNSAVSVDSTGNTVTFCPALIANVRPSSPKPMQIAGTLAAIDPMGGTLTVSRRAVGGSTIGNFVVAAAAGTVFQVDGTVYTGSTGLAALALLPLGTTHLLVQGTLSSNSRTLDAVAVEAGAGVAGNGQDWVYGHIVGRDHSASSDATLTVLGRSLDGSSGTRRFNTAFSVGVQLGSTHVLRRGFGNSLTTDALDVGQRILAFGTLTGTALDTTGASTSTGVVRMLPTNVFGIAAGAAVSNTLTLNVTRFDLRTISDFNFSVGGLTEATPSMYTVDVTGLDTTGITTGSKISCLGFVNPVGLPSDRDFIAGSVANHASGASVLLCQWVPVSAIAIPSIATNVVSLDVSTATISVVGDGFAPVTVTNSPTPTIVPLAGLGFYSIWQGGTLEFNVDFNAFGTSLQTRLGAGASVFRISSLGLYDPSTQTFSALSATVILN